MKCITSVKFSFVINGKVYDGVKPSCGLRQGDHLSPFLFVLCAQGLSSILTSFEEQRLVKGIHIAQSASSLSHLFFADDNLLLFKIEDHGVQNIQRALNLYSKASGQLINFNKSAAIFSPCVSIQMINSVMNKLGFKQVQEHSFYLGLPTFSARKKRLQFDFLREKVGCMVQSWKSRFFSIGGREVLIKSILQAILIYAMSCFRIATSVCLEIEKLCQKFWWGNLESERKIHWTKWEQLCKPKSMEGIGFRKLEAFNQALLAKQIWRIIMYPNSMVARILKVRYFRKVDIMEAKVTCNSSFIWHSLCWGRKLLDEGLLWKPMQYSPLIFEARRSMIDATGNSLRMARTA